MSLQLPTPAEFAAAAAIVDSDAVIGVFAACEWDCLDDDGKTWIATIIREAGTRGEGRFRRMVERIASWSEDELTVVDARQVRHVAQVVLAGADPIYPSFAPISDREQGA